MAVKSSICVAATACEYKRKNILFVMHIKRACVASCIKPYISEIHKKKIIQYQENVHYFCIMLYLPFSTLLWIFALFGYFLFVGALNRNTFHHKAYKLYLYIIMYSIYVHMYIYMFYTIAFVFYISYDNTV